MVIRSCNFNCCKRTGEPPYPCSTMTSSAYTAHPSTNGPDLPSARTRLEPRTRRDARAMAQRLAERVRTAGAAEPGCVRKLQEMPGHRLVHGQVAHQVIVVLAVERLDPLR